VPADITSEKHAVRERVWALLEAAHAVESGVAGHIPAFAGMEQAAQRLTTLPAWQAANSIQANPDRAQLPVRVQALGSGKVVYMAVPKLADPLPFYELNPRRLPVAPRDAGSHEQAARVGRKVGIEDVLPLDLVVCGSVAVNPAGARLGKGAGYSDIELALLAEAGVLTERTVIATTVHELQVVDDELPEADHDFRVDVIVTPQRVIASSNRKRPCGVRMESFSEEQIASIPILAHLVRRHTS
jgi:5-formyltetrahydrofolate cyclo-ligase